MGTEAEKIRIVDISKSKGEKEGAVKKEALVDAGATVLTLPEEIVAGLGLTRGGFVTASYADGTKKRRQIGRGVIIEIMGREALVDCVIEPAGRILIGQIPLEEMDLIVDTKSGKLMPCPESPDTPFRSLWIK